MFKHSGNFVIGVKIALALGTIFLSTADTPRAAERNLRVSYSAPATAFLPLWAAKDAGIFERNNLSVELLYVGSSPIALSPAIEPDDIKLILEHLAQTNPKAREIQPALLIYNDLVANVARSGLIERLYK